MADLSEENRPGQTPQIEVRGSEHPPTAPSQKQKDKSVAKQYDPFYLRKVYPDAAAIFSHHPKKLGDVKDEAVVVLDTSVLLLPYDTNSGSLKEIERVYTRIAKRDALIVPAQVAREFAAHRFEKLKDLVDKVEKKRDSLQNVQLESSSLLNAIPEIKEFKGKIKQINGIYDEARDLLTKAARAIREWYCDDPVSHMYRHLFTSQVVTEVAADDEELRKDNEFRNTHDVAPGFKDRDKPDGGIGDKVVWRCILEIGAAKGPSDSCDERLHQGGPWPHNSEGTAFRPLRAYR